MTEILQRLKQRKLVQWALAYVAFAFALMQGADIVAHQFGWPGGLQRGFTVVLVIGFFAALVVAWYHGERGMQHVSGTEIMILALLLAIGGGLLWQFARPTSLPGPDATQWRSAVATSETSADAVSSRTHIVDMSATPIASKSIAVLPLVNGGGEGQQFFSDGLSEALIIALSQFDGMKVIGRNSSFQFRDSKDSSAAIGRKLGVAHLLEGSVQHAGNVVRVSVELIDAASGQTRWSEQYDRPYQDLFKLQDEITLAVAGALQAKLLVPNEAIQQNDRPPSGSVEAYNAYLQGLKYWHDQDFSKAAGYMERAVKIDPGYALAWAHLSGSWSTVAAFWNEPPAVAREHMQEARLAADKALQLAPDLGAAHAARAYLQFYHFDFRSALSECRRAVELAPDDGTVLNGCAYTLAGIGKLGEAIRLRERLLSIEPLYTTNYREYATLLAVTGRLGEAEKYLRTSEEVAEPYPMEHLKLALLRGDASATLAIASQSTPEDHNLSMALATQIGPDGVVADQWLARMLADKAWVESFDSDDYDNFYKIAQVYALRGDVGETLVWLQRSMASNPSRALFLLFDPFLLRFRDDPRFIAFCTNLGLPPPSESEALSIDQLRAMQAATRLSERSRNHRTADWSQRSAT